MVFFMKNVTFELILVIWKFIFYEKLYSTPLPKENKYFKTTTAIILGKHCELPSFWH